MACMSEAPKPDVGEEVTVELAPTVEIPAMIRDGRIDHALAVMGLFWWLDDRRGQIVPAS